MTGEDKTISIEINRKNITWDLEEGTLRSVGMLSVILWLRPSLLHVLLPLVDELGVPLFRLLVAYHSSLGTEDDYQRMVTKLGKTFEEGFLAWGDAVSASGWGRFELPVFDRAAHRAVVRVKNPWEFQMQADVKERWGCPFLQGKIIGIFSHAIGVNCWADEVDAEIEGASSRVEFHVYASNKTIPSELDSLRRTQKEATRRKIAETVQELYESEARKLAILSSLGEIVFTLDPHGHFTTYHVPEELAALADPPSEVLGRAVHDVFPRSVADPMQAALGQVLMNNAPETLSYERERNGERRFFGAKMSALRSQDGEVAGVTVIERDLTERVRAERALAERLALIEQQRETIRALSTPILEVWDGVLALPIIGAMDRQRSAMITEDLLDAIVKTKARFVVLDLTAVDTIDAAAADHLARIMRAVKLLGTECLVCGIRPWVAQTMAALGQGALPSRTFDTMRSALLAIQRRA
jgi:rsbT co-antagonist protein RsbR